jgi:hypothetical protein
VPRFVGRIFTGELGVAYMTEIRDASNAKAKRDLGWQPAHPSWRQGFREVSEAGIAQPARDAGEQRFPS